MTCTKALCVCGHPVPPPTLATTTMPQVNDRTQKGCATNTCNGSSQSNGGQERPGVKTKLRKHSMPSLTSLTQPTMIKDIVRDGGQGQIKVPGILKASSVPKQ